MRFKWIGSGVVAGALIAGSAALVGAQSEKSLPARVDALETAIAGALARLVALEQRAQDAAVDVDCAAGESLNAALAANDGVLGWVRITIHGSCHESVVIARNRTTLLAAEPGDGIVSVNPQNSAVRVLTSRDVVLLGLTLSGGMQGLRLSGDATVRLQNCTITGNAFQGVQVDGGSLSMVTSTVSGNGTGVDVFEGGRVRISGSTISGNTQMGMWIHSGASALLDANSVVSGNHGGIVVWGGDLNLRLASVQNNTGDGVQGVLGARLVLEPQSIIQNNAGNGLRLGDTAVAGLVGTMHVVNNGGWGVLCVGSPAIAQYVAGPGVVTGNIGGQISCPTSTIFPIGG